jgi:ferredoxin-NADP reductase
MVVAADPSRANSTFDLLVKRVEWEADGVVSLVLTDAGQRLLPGWTPGAHIDVILPSGLVRQYSLCGDTGDRSRYRIAVLKEREGRGGSKELHETALIGRTLAVAGPRNHFELVESSDYLFIAGGIGITPILPMVREAARRGANWRLVYGGRTRGSMGFLGELEGISAGRIDVIPQDERGVLPIAEILAGTAIDAQIYCCGPDGLLAAVEAQCSAFTPPRQLHVERFATARLTDVPDAAENRPIVVHCARRGVTLDVPADRSILDVVLEQVDEDYMFGCTEGVCGSCETTVLDGVPEHRDEVLTDQERAAGISMMICVGRAQTPSLTLDI